MTAGNRGGEPRRILIDCDPGHDDAIAIMLAHGDPGVQLVGITTVGGNQTLDKVTHNARVVATVCGMTGVPIAAGSAVPLIRPIRTAAAIHGESGMDGPVLPEPTVPLDDRHGVDLIIDTVMDNPPGSITLVPTAPLTNIALAVRKCPAIVERVAEVVLMGGGYSKGNVTPAAEFNIAVDPEAAQIVFTAPWQVTMVGIDLTHQALATPAVQQRISDIGTPAAQFVVDLLAAYGANYRAEQGFGDPPVHDPCAVARVIDPSVMTVRPAHVEVELAGRLTAGMTVCDFLGRDGARLDTDVAITLDAPAFWDLVVDAITAIGRP
ncbi:uridine-preferring nucleoside hydrolase UriH [Nakamurella lactea]|uniref:uridine-preferring nucleoside hydrolase UriH n=1 Tax=Nakamurella lactea TaxID=459515 RepID=UPI000423708F|nr:nucleoside hydrolase [Nakamurella lactea]